MTRITTTLLVFLLLSNGAVTIMASSGLSEDLGVTVAPGISEEVKTLEDRAKNGFSASQGAAETLFTLFGAAMNTVSLLVKSIFALPTMLTNLGFPGWFVGALIAPLYVISTLEVLYAATGRVMV